MTPSTTARIGGQPDRQNAHEHSWQKREDRETATYKIVECLQVSEPASNIDSCGACLDFLLTYSMGDSLSMASLSDLSAATEPSLPAITTRVQLGSDSNNK